MEKRTGRPLELTAEVAKRLSEAFKEGASIRVACGLAGISDGAYKEWMQRGRAGEPRFAPFVALMEKARAKPELQAYQAIRKAFLTDKNPDWKAAVRYIELKDPNRWKKDKGATPEIRVTAADIIREIVEAKKGSEPI